MKKLFEITLNCVFKLLFVAVKVLLLLLFIGIPRVRFFHKVTTIAIFGKFSENLENGSEDFFETSTTHAE